jgi:hypothetical protein
LIATVLTRAHEPTEITETTVPDAAAKRIRLPVPTDDHPDVGERLIQLATNREPRVDVLVGPDDVGKSALVRILAPRYRALGDVVRTVDLSIVDWRQSLLGNQRLDVVLIDHIDRLPEPEHFRSAFDILDRGVPLLFAAGLSRLILTFNTDWRRDFRGLYRLAPERLLEQALAEVHVAVHMIRPYSDDELKRSCDELDLDSRMFSEPQLRRAGVLALAAAVDDESPQLTGAWLREVLAYRWIEAGNGIRSSTARREIWELMGRLALRDERFSFQLNDLRTALNNAHETDTLRAQAGGPLRLKGDQVEWTSPAWGDVAGANALRAAIRDPRIEVTPRPVRKSVLDALLNTSDRNELAREVARGMRVLRQAEPTRHGYLGAVLGTLMAEVEAGPHLILEDLPLQGPDHSHLQPVHNEVASVVRDALKDAMMRSAHRLMSVLRTLPNDARSGFRGGYEYWSTARAWAGALPLRASAEGLLAQLPNDGEWRYEDILDVAVTGATTAFLDNVSDGIRTAVEGRAATSSEYLADVWDGVNDGAWDQIDATARDYVGSFFLPPEMGRKLIATRCSLQRARLGAQDVGTWRLTECDLLLADFRSCRNVEKADFRGSNWWAAILPPPARYFLSRDCQDPEFLRWCASPPWANPYYTENWPVPFPQSE